MIKQSRGKFVEYRLSDNSIEPPRLARLAAVLFFCPNKIRDCENYPSNSLYACSNSEKNRCVQYQDKEQSFRKRIWVALTND